MTTPALQLDTREFAHSPGGHPGTPSSNHPVIDVVRPSRRPLTPYDNRVLAALAAEIVTACDARRRRASWGNDLGPHHAGNGFNGVRHDRHTARYIDAARSREPAGDEHDIAAGESDAALATVREFLIGASESPDDERTLATVLFTDIVGSTERATALGDRAWRDLLERHHEVVRREIRCHRGREIDAAGDGFFATFDGPTRGVRCALAIRDAVKSLGLEIRGGLHTGECERVDYTIGGIAVHIGARVAAAASPGEVLVSRTVKDLVAGSGLRFVDRGVHVLKGVAGEWRLFLAESAT